MPAEAKEAIVAELETKFEFLMERLGVFGTREIVSRYVPTDTSALPEYTPASEALTAAATVDPNEGE
jgi:hypothetical protein